MEPSLQAKQLKLKRARLADDLNDKISHRPGPIELIHKNILPVPSLLGQHYITDTHVLYKATRLFTVKISHLKEYQAKFNNIDLINLIQVLQRVIIPHWMRTAVMAYLLNSKAVRTLHLALSLSTLPLICLIRTEIPHLHRYIPDLLYILFIRENINQYFWHSNVAF